MSREPEEDVKDAIDLTNMCQELHCLPGPGGLLDQDAYHIHMMRCVIIAQREAEEIQRKKDSRGIK